jgi:UDP-N-acetylmuramyl pentapeptide phosphotransferase/UDP-N-acetylglucosamine-1-phosphate transferase
MWRGGAGNSAPFGHSGDGVSNLPWLIATAAAAFAASAALSAAVQRGLIRWEVLDKPNQRSSHARPVPRGGGLGFTVVILLGWAILLAHGSAAVTPAVLIAAVLIAAVSFADDLVGVPRRARFAVQVVAVILALWFFPFDGNIVCDALPFAADRIVAGLAWLWFVNLFNFMDGIDGIAASEGAIVGLGIVALAIAAPALSLPAPEAIVVAAAAAAFLLFNWAPARMFMGDVGSTALGFLLGWLLLVTAARGAVIPAVILPLAFVADASSTLALRAWLGRRITDAHREHAYQRAVDRGRSHAAVTASFAAAGIVLIGAAIFALSHPLAGAVVAAIVVAGLLYWLRRG